MKVAAASAHGFVLTVHRRRLLVVITTVFPLCSRTAPVLSISLGAAPEAQVGCTPGPTGVCQGAHRRAWSAATRRTQVGDRGRRP